MPILFVHQGHSWYLWHTLRQTRLTNPTSEIYLITDRPHRRYEPFALQVDLATYFSAASSFEDIYVHLSTQPRQAELICFQRWFVIDEFVRERAIESYVYLDSDVLVYTDLQAEQKKFASAELTVTNGHGPETMFVNGSRSLERFCSFVTESYEHRRTELEKAFHAYLVDHTAGGICDMWLLGEYRALHPDRIADTFVVRDGSIFDDNVNDSQGFGTDHGLKALVWSDGAPFGREIESGRLVRFNTIHCQGVAKRHIPRWASDKDWRVHLRSTWLRTPEAYRSARARLRRARTHAEGWRR